MAYLKNWTDNFFQIFCMGTSWVAISITKLKRAEKWRHERAEKWRYDFFFKTFDFNGVNVANHWHVAGRGICHLWLPYYAWWCTVPRQSYSRKSNGNLIRRHVSLEAFRSELKLFKNNNDICKWMNQFPQSFAQHHEHENIWTRR